MQFKNIKIDNLALIFILLIIRQKIVCIVGNCPGIKHIIVSLKKSPFKLEDSKEEFIFLRFEKIARNIITYYPMIYISNLSVQCTGFIAAMDPPYALPYNGWFPYNYTRTSKTYWATAVYQMLVAFTMGSINAISDMLLPCIMCYMCGHIHILRYRFRVMTEKLRIMSDNNEPEDEIISTEQKLIADWVKFHIDILNLFKYTNKIFSTVIFMQYTISSLVLCTIAYLLSHMEPMTMGFAGNFGFLTAMFIQILLPCYFADKLTFEFLDISTGIYDTNWYHLSNNIRRSIVIILRKTYRPVTLTSGFFIVLSLESFTKVIKLAYTIYNVLE
ncbi:odorant receptor 2a-like isoform X2 [Microplitis mediator]|uniref:odorant receptor 2a-like isoform X2 n=1 Tax=Microplitis mediator TaxID=375433 RepID=UPI00255681DA|nr:odorant receptor 2a-like isoform X2 [Microplitis mediator]